MKTKSVITIFAWGVSIIILLVCGPYDGTKLSSETFLLGIVAVVPNVLIVYWERAGIKKLWKILFGNAPRKIFS